jgi:predicted ATP-binding protein involved in virulence
LAPNWNDWLNKNEEKGGVRLDMIMDARLDSFWKDDIHIRFNEDQSLAMETTLQRRNRDKKDSEDSFILKDVLSLGRGRAKRFDQSSTDDWKGSFSAAYGPYRRFGGGNAELERLFSNPFYGELGAHLSALTESVALTEIVRWLRELHHKSLEKDKESMETIASLLKLINSPDFLPHGARMTNISSDGVFFTDGHGITISVSEMSDGYRSILSLTFELLRQLVRVYGATQVFKHIKKGKMIVDLPGVVLIDEVDAHLHPTWQTRIGGWFTKYFPKLQFIVTTHSPLVCRAADKGSIWRLAAPKSESPSHEITGVEKDRLIFGNVLDAYGTDIFGVNLTISKEAAEKRNRLAALNLKSIMGQVSAREAAEMSDLKAVFPTENLSAQKG